MTRQEQRVLKALTKIGVLVKVNDDGFYDDRPNLWLDFEEPQNQKFANYFSNTFGTDQLNKAINELGMFWEWNNPGYASIHKI